VPRSVSLRLIRSGLGLRPLADGFQDGGPPEHLHAPPEVAIVPAVVKGIVGREGICGHYARPGREWGTGFVLSSPGCWELRLATDTTAAGVWIDVPA